MYNPDTQRLCATERYSSLHSLGRLVSERKSFKKPAASGRGFVHRSRDESININ